MKKENQSIEHQLEKVRKSITKAYSACFNKFTDFNHLKMLEQIENELESIYSKIALIPPSFMTSKQNEKEKQRRERQKKERQELAEILQKQKN